MLQLKAVHLGEKEEKKEEVAADIQTLLEQYSVLFQEPKGLPPTRAHDHQIPILTRQGPVSVRPYRYPFLSKERD